MGWRRGSNVGSARERTAVPFVDQAAGRLLEIQLVLLLVMKLGVLGIRCEFAKASRRDNQVPERRDCLFCVITEAYVAFWIYTKGRCDVQCRLGISIDTHTGMSMKSGAVKGLDTNKSDMPLATRGSERVVAVKVRLR